MIYDSRQVCPLSIFCPRGAPPRHPAVDELSRAGAFRPARTRGARSHAPVDVMNENSSSQTTLNLSLWIQVVGWGAALGWLDLSLNGLRSIPPEVAILTRCCHPCQLEHSRLSRSAVVLQNSNPPQIRQLILDMNYDKG